MDNTADRTRQAPELGEEQAREPVTMQARHRRAPRYGRFMAVGLLLAGLIAFGGALATRGWSELTTSNFFWLALIWLGPTLMGGGALLAYILDRRSIAAMDRQ